MKAAERRRTPRRPVLDSFSLFVVIPKKGIHRLQVHDLSDHGMCFDLETEGEAAEDFPIATGESIDLRFYLNQSLYLPLSFDVVRVEDKKLVRRVGAEFADKKSKNYQAFLSFLQMLDTIIDSVRLDT